LHCAHCQTDNPPEYKYCQECGEELLELFACQDCGHPNHHEYKFCEECGHDLKEGLCPQCGHQTVGGAKFCQKCGAALAAKPPPPAPEQPEISAVPDPTQSKPRSIAHQPTPAPVKRTTVQAAPETAARRGAPRWVQAVIRFTISAGIGFLFVRMYYFIAMIFD